MKLILEGHEPDTEAIRELADFIEHAVPAKRFYFGSWVQGAKKLLNIKSFSTDHACTTTGCGLGWATAMPKFKSRGLRWMAESDMPSLNGSTDMGVISKGMFNASAEVGYILFLPQHYSPCTGWTSPGSYCSGEEWAKNARKVADQLDKEWAERIPRPREVTLAVAFPPQKYAETTQVEKPQSLANS